jgi:hypothetical protein
MDFINSIVDYFVHDVFQVHPTTLIVCVILGIYI